MFGLTVCLCAILVLSTAGCLGGYTYALSTIDADTESWRSNVPKAAVLRGTLQCLVAAEAEWEQQMEYAHEPGTATAAAVESSKLLSTKSCGSSMLRAAPDLFRPVLQRLGAVRNAAGDSQGSVSVALNYTELAASLSATMDRTTLSVPSVVRPSALFAEPLAVVGQLRVSVTAAAALHLLGGVAAGADLLLTQIAANMRVQLSLLQFAPDGIGDLLRTPAALVCLDALQQQLAQGGTAAPRNTCGAFRESLGVQVDRVIAGLESTVDDRASTLDAWGYVLIAMAIVMLLMLGYGCVVVVLSQRQSTAELEAEIATRREITESVQAFVPAQFLVILGLRVITEVAVDDPKHVEVTVLASDIRSFTTISEQMSDVELFAWLQEHLANMTAATRRAGGFIEKYIGDAVLCVFEEPGEAIRCGIDMQYVVAEANVTRGTRGEEHMVRIGVGIHTGPTYIGILGDETVQNTAVVGRSVDVAAKLEELTKVYGAKLIITEDSFDAAGLDLPDHRRLGEVKVDRLQVRIVEVYATEPQDIREYKTATRVEFEAAVHARDRGNISAANGHFDSVLKAPRPAGYSDLAAVKVIEM